VGRRNLTVADVPSPSHSALHLLKEGTVDFTEIHNSQSEDFHSHILVANFMFLFIKSEVFAATEFSDV
jgi:hypothetical protein